MGALGIAERHQRAADVGGLEHAEDAQALLEPDPVVADRPGEDDVGEALDPSAERSCVIDPAGVPGVDHVDLLAGHHGTEPDERPGRAEHERLEDEVVVAGQERHRPGQLGEEARRVHEPAGVERCLLERHHALDRRHRPERLGLEVDPGERGLELEQDQRQPDVRDRLVVVDGDSDVQRLAQVGRDREHQEGIRPGRLEVPRLAHGSVGRGTGQAGDDRQVGHLAHDPQDAQALIVGEMGALAGVDIDRQCNRSLAGDPADVGAQRRLVDAAVGMHRQDRRRDQAVEVQGHRCSGSRRSGARR